MANAKDLETESQGFITEDDLICGASVVWKHMGTPYTAEVVEVYGKHYNSIHYVCTNSHLYTST